MNLTKLLTLLLLFLPGIALSQVPSVEHEYLSGIAMTKVVVCTDDLSVFALSATGKVYYKRVNDTDFQLYLPAAALTVADLDGYNFNEMYFLLAPDVIQSFIQNVPHQIKITNSGVNKITGLAIMNGKRAETLRGYYGTNDWLALTTNNGMYPVFRGDNFASSRYNRNASAPGTEGNWRITNSSFDRVDFQYESTNESVCYPTATHSYYNPAFDTNTLPETAPYSPKVNCTLIENIPYRPLTVNRALYWGTDNGIFAKMQNECDGIVRYLPGMVINDLEEIELLKGIGDERYVYAATDQGLYYNSRIGIVSLDERIFAPVPGVSGKVNSFAVQAYRQEDTITEDSIFDCQQTIWVAAENGIKQVKINIDPRRGVGVDLSYNPLPHGGDGSAPAWSFCGDVLVKLTISGRKIDLNKYIIKWSSRDVFIDSLQNKISVDVPAGEWRAHVISRCEGIEGRSVYAFIRKTPAPTLQMDVVGSLYACPGNAVKLVTGTQYVVQWQKNGVDIPDANSANYMATEPGKYRVMANICPGRFEPSKEVEVFIENIPAIAISRSSTQSLCYGESVKLSAPVVSGATYKWSSGETTREIDVKTTGSYSVTVSRSGCSKVSDTQNVTVAAQPFKEPTQNLRVCTDRSEVLTLTAPAGYAAYTWNGVRGTSATFEVTEPGQYILRVEDASGCSASMTYVVTPGCSGVDLSKAVVSNAFSPNGDGVNDTWVVRGLDNNPDARITIYTRYSATVFDGTGENPIWDGKYNSQPLPTGTYYYKIWDAKSSKAIQGSITLIK